MLRSVATHAEEDFTMRTDNYDHQYHTHPKLQKALSKIGTILEERRTIGFTGAISMKLDFGNGVPSAINIQKKDEWDKIKI